MIPKFRAWDKHLKIMRDITYIDFKNQEVMFYADDYKDYEDAPNLDIVRNFEEVELMQSTGLKDKNGTEIFEGDILDFVVYNFYDGSDKRLKGKIIYKYSSFILQTLDTEEEYDLFRVLLDDEEVEILGNIYENPEMMEE